MYSLCAASLITAQGKACFAEELNKRTDKIIRGGLLTKPKERMPSSWVDSAEIVPEKTFPPVKIVEPNVSYQTEEDPLQTDEYKNNRISNLIGKPCKWNRIYDANTGNAGIYGDERTEPPDFNSFYDGIKTQPRAKESR